MSWNIKKLKKLRSSKTLQEIGNIYGVSRERIRQLIGNAVTFQKYPKGYWRCYRCKKILLSSLFYKSKEKPHTHRCIKCTKELSREWMNKKYYREYLSGGKYNQQKRARHSVRRGLECKTLEKGNCFMKDNTCNGRLEAHHYLGYEQKNYRDIQWVCRKHHQEIDGVKWGRHDVL